MSTPDVLLRVAQCEALSNTDYRVSQAAARPGRRNIALRFRFTKTYQYCRVPGAMRQGIFRPFQPEGTHVVRGVVHL